MNVTNKVLKLLGMKLASELITGQVDPEVKLWRAVIVLAIEDVLNPSESRNESVAKAEAHDWFVNNSDDFQKVCYNGGLDADWVRDRYLLALDKKVITFTEKQHLYVKYTKMYEQLRGVADVKTRKKIQKAIEKLRTSIFES